MSTCTPHQVFPPKPNFTEENLPDQTGKVFLVTGGASGIGLELCKLLYAANATIYIATRSVSKIASAIQYIEACSPFSQGRLESLSLDLADLSTIKPAAEEFLARELRLDVLVHNAGVMMPPKGSTSAQGYDMQMATNTLGPFLLTQCLEGRLRATTRMQNAAKDSVRVVWIASMISVGAPKGGIVWNDETNSPKLLGDPMGDYMQSKVGCVFLANEFGKKMKDNGIVSLSVHPGLVKTELQRHAPAAMAKIMGAIFKGPKHAAYTELFAACSPDVTMENSGSYIIPWGRFGCIPADIAQGMSPSSSGGWLAGKLWNYCLNQTSSYL